MRVLVWHVHGSWMTAFLQGPHEYFIPTLPSRGPDGLGRARTWTWPQSAVEVTPSEASAMDFDAVVAQRPVELEHLIESWTGRRPVHELPVVYVEHNTPPHVGARHVSSGHRGVTVAHVTHFNACMWDCGDARTAVIEHGVVDPGERYTGELRRAVAVVNEPVRRGVMTGTDIIDRLRRDVPLDLFGMETSAAGGSGELTQDDLHTAMARRRVYLHACRWTSLGLSLVEAMTLGMPVVAVASTAVPESVPAEAGVVSTDTRRLRDGLCRFIHDGEAAQRAGRAARAHALQRFGLQRFLDDWSTLLESAA